MFQLILSSGGHVDHLRGHGQMGPNPMEALKFKQYYRFCTCDVINSLYFPSREIATVATFVEVVNKFIGAEFEGLIVGTNTADSKG